jgi:hypothetical protein
MASPLPQGQMVVAVVHHGGGLQIALLGRPRTTREGLLTTHILGQILEEADGARVEQGGFAVSDLTMPPMGMALDAVI